MDEQAVGRIDYQLNKSHRLFARYYYDHLTSPAVNEPTSPPYNVFNTTSGEEQFWDSATIGDTWAPTSKAVLETRVSFLNIVSDQNPPASSSFVTIPIWARRTIATQLLLGWALPWLAT